MLGQKETNPGGGVESKGENFATCPSNECSEYGKISQSIRYTIYMHGPIDHSSIGNLDKFL